MTANYIRGFKEQDVSIKGADKTDKKGIIKLVQFENVAAIPKFLNAMFPLLDRGPLLNAVIANVPFFL